MDGDPNLCLALLYGYPPFFSSGPLIFSAWPVTSCVLNSETSQRTSVRWSSAKPICGFGGMIWVMLLVYIYSVEQRLWWLNRENANRQFIDQISRYDNWCHKHHSSIRWAKCQPMWATKCDFAALVSGDGDIGKLVWTRPEVFYGTLDQCVHWGWLTRRLSSISPNSCGVREIPAGQSWVWRLIRHGNSFLGDMLHLG